jgi:hypothetical protein
LRRPDFAQKFPPITVGKSGKEENQMTKKIILAIVFGLVGSASIAVARAENAREVTMRPQSLLQLATKKMVEIPSISEVSLARRENQIRFGGVVKHNVYRVVAGETAE